MKIESYLNSIKSKEFIYLLLSIPIIVFIVYDNFILPKLENETKKLIKIEKLNNNKLEKIISEIRNLKNLDKILPPLEQQLQNDKEDYKYIKYALYDTPIILLNNSNFYKNLSKILDMSKKLNLNISTTIDNSQKHPPFNSYIVMNIKGSGKYLDIINFIRYIESIKLISYLDKINIALSLKKHFNYNKFFQISVKNVSSISFTLTKYTQNELNTLKKYGQNLKFKFEPNKNNLNYIDLSYVGNYNQIYQIYNNIKSIESSKDISIKNIKINLKRNHNKNISKHFYYFDININFMGIK